MTIAISSIERASSIYIYTFEKSAEKCSALLAKHIFLINIALYESRLSLLILIIQRNDEKVPEPNRNFCCNKGYGYHFRTSAFSQFLCNDLREKKSLLCSVILSLFRFIFSYSVNHHCHKSLHIWANYGWPRNHIDCHRWQDFRAKSQKFI